MAKIRATAAFDNVLPFPPTTTPASVVARQAVKNLARAKVITEREAVQSLHDMGATAEEIDLVRAIYAVRRRKL